MPPATDKAKNHPWLDRISLAMSLSILVLAGLAFLNRQAIFDYLRLRNYTPSASIQQLAIDTTLVPQSRKVFFVNRPEIQDKSAFNIDCPNRGGEKTIVLGCYHGGQNGIYLLGVEDPRLDGVLQVTAAHELLHAQYDRLSEDDKAEVDALLLDYYRNQLKDERIKETIEGYRKTEPNDLINEMHSIFATEIKDLPPALEKYYARYFEDRKQIVAFAEQYQAEFTSRQETIKRDDAQLASLKQRITSGEADLKTLQEQITNRQQDLLARQRSGDIAGYNAGVPAYNASIDQYNRLVRQIKDLVNQYNILVAERNKLASEIAELSGALDTNATQIKQ